MKSANLLKAEADVLKLRQALIGLIGAESAEELKRMEAELQKCDAPEADKIAAINGVHALLETIPAAVQRKEIQ